MKSIARKKKQEQSNVITFPTAYRPAITLEPLEVTNLHEYLVNGIAKPCMVHAADGAFLIGDATFNPPRVVWAIHKHSE